MGYRLQPLVSLPPHPLPLSAHPAWWSGLYLKPHVAVSVHEERMRSFALQPLEWDRTDMPACISATSMHMAADWKIWAPYWIVLAPAHAHRHECSLTLQQWYLYKAGGATSEHPCHIQAAFLLNHWSKRGKEGISPLTERDSKHSQMRVAYFCTSAFLREETSFGFWGVCTVCDNSPLLNSGTIWFVHVYVYNRVRVALSVCGLGKLLKEHSVFPLCLRGLALHSKPLVDWTPETRRRTTCGLCFPFGFMCYCLHMSDYCC